VAGDAAGDADEEFAVGDGRGTPVAGGHRGGTEHAAIAGVEHFDFTAAVCQYKYFAADEDGGGVLAFGDGRLPEDAASAQIAADDGVAGGAVGMADAIGVGEAGIHHVTTLPVRRGGGVGVAVKDMPKFAGGGG